MSFYDQLSDAGNFCVGFTKDPKKDFGVFAKGYALAAERLATQLLKRSRFSCYEAYPIAFLYRHALEISLKHIIYVCMELMALKYLGNLDERLENTHDLGKLCAIVTASLTLLYPEDDFLRKTLANLAGICSDLSDIDARADAYRYPIDSKGHRATKGQVDINLRAFATQMSTILEDLDTIRFALGAERDLADEVYLTSCSML